MLVRNILPLKKESSVPGKYDIYPSFKIRENRISEGYASLAREICRHRIIKIDGFSGVFFDDFKQKIDFFLTYSGFKAAWHYTGRFMNDPGKILDLTKPFSGAMILSLAPGVQCLSGISSKRNSPGTMICENDNEITIFYGPGAFLTGLPGLLIIYRYPEE
ncbi:MAG: hypothetical protein MZV63_29595 [Marinilabiliales bacterium]|nr:hypothetical protein [Marinilabiliales bacterium]